MILGALFVTFLWVLATICDDVPNDDDNQRFPGAASHASATSRRHRHRKDHERNGRSPGKSVYGRDSTETPANETGAGGNANSASRWSASGALNLAGNTTASLVSQTAGALNLSGNTSTSSGAASNTSEASSPAASGNTSLSSGSAIFGLNAANLQHDGVFLGFLPDGGDAGGIRQTMAEINSAVGKTAATYGWYGQAISGTLFDGSQLLAVLDDVKASQAVFQPAVMPVKGWQGLTSSDNSQAVAIAQVMKKFTDQGIPVWLRFAHEMNYYQTDGTYEGTAADFKAGWAAVAAACKSIAPDVKMWWTPNVASAANYAQYAPDDMSTVHLVGIDYYPKSLSTGTEFVDTMKAFHDLYAVDGRMFAIGETGLGYAGSPADRFSWLSQITSARAQMKNYIASSWFNYNKDYDYQIVSVQTPSLTSSLKSFLSI
ncbi:uncharacterized protein VP01_335g5 [Puccinia sorghi]|uniref:GH26 domain-containing protein n=1 Tax=Puccinia sorghi TaxID=27349 RepID=A0A0L6UWW8_9BASI|nr:uncharacterized protein VP01_335g5 [Puccinia sorghi]